ncbi:DUF2141 domain-containing protein [Novosphingobium beihaiensis]|uniref:DUF2141 domain-containing protein n=1 Tax=Novosphingobium beihaiensis TaxID=2930389 RepID=A0ABT0BQ63_9SPHN|nr:DUF2141 domain-containing protein [Novosphingobium beihaiensis]MCJ2187118.1 DUF2141 domain-containing protein [Novosphingobium beihaiensis]
MKSNSGGIRRPISLRWKLVLAAALATGGTAVLAAASSAAVQYRHEIRNDMSRCTAGSPSAVMVTVDGIKASEGDLRIQTYHATRGEWLEKGKWLSRIEVPAKAGTMTFCLPVPGPGSYGVAVRHDLNGNGKTDITSDGGAMSNNPSINIFNLGKPSYTKVGVPVNGGVKSIRIQMKYF